MMPPAALAVVRAAHEDARRAGHSSRTAARHALAELAADGWEIRVVEPRDATLHAWYVSPVQATYLARKSDVCAQRSSPERTRPWPVKPASN